MTFHRSRAWHTLTLTAAGAGVAALALVAPMSLTANADPDAVKAAQAKLEAIEQQSSELADNYSALDGRLTSAQAKVVRLQKDVVAQQKKIDGQVGSMGQLALMQYQNSGLDLTTRLLASADDSTFMRNLATAQSVTSLTNDRVQSYQGAQAKLKFTTAELVAARDQIVADKAEQAKVMKQVEVREAQARAVVAKLTAEEKQRLEQARKAKAEAEARRLAAQNSRSETRPTAPSSQGSSSSTSPGSSSSAPTTPAQPAAGSSRGEAAAAWALSKVGGPYVYGGTGPTGYDCSGLTGGAWRSVGVSLPRTSQAQYSVGVPVSLSQLQPGDLVFYYSGITHVGIYVGNGQIVDAANPRSGIRKTSVTGNYMPFMGARRVG